MHKILFISILLVIMVQQGSSNILCDKSKPLSERLMYADDICQNLSKGELRDEVEWFKNSFPAKTARLYLHKMINICCDSRKCLLIEDYICNHKNRK